MENYYYFNPGDLVVIVAQSKDINAHIGMVGLSGYIEEIKGDYAQFVELREDGLGGSGGVPLSCLQIANDNIRLQNLKRAREERLDGFHKEAEEQIKRYNKSLKEYLARASEETGVPIEKIKQIFAIHEQFQQEWDNTYGW